MTVSRETTTPRDLFVRQGFSITSLSDKGNDKNR